MNSNAIIRDAIRRIALKGIVNNATGAVRGTGRVSGYVAKIHDDESDELFGTIDVQEYVQLAVDENDEMQMGYHEGVLLSAIQDNSKGYVIVPKLYSEVLVSHDSDSGTEYVSMYSHVDLRQYLRFSKKFGFFICVLSHRLKARIMLVGQRGENAYFGTYDFLQTFHLSAL